MASDGLFIIGHENFERALELGLYPALAYLVLARGTQRNNLTTAWSAKAVKTAVGVRWHKARAAIEELIDSRLVSSRARSVKSRPMYRLSPIEGDKVFLPNTLVDGIESIPSPLRRVRESQNPDVLKLLVNFYRLQNLADEHGISRDCLHQPAGVDFIMELGPFKVWAAVVKGVYRTSLDGELAKPWQYNTDAFWDALKALDGMGLIELVWYVTDADGELLYPFNEDVRDAIENYIEACEIPSHLSWQGDCHFLTLRHQSKPQFVGLYRARFRTPHTAMTGEWASDIEQMQRDMLGRLRS